jgi:hypothetical protein
VRVDLVDPVSLDVPDIGVRRDVVAREVGTIAPRAASMTTSSCSAIDRPNVMPP